MWVHTLNPTLVHIGPLEIRWYGIVYVLGFFLSIWWLHHLRKQNKLALTKDQIWDFTFFLLLGVIVGARLFMIFWDPQTFLFKPWNLLRVWDGGMSFHGGLVGIIVAAYWYCKRKKISFLRMADIMAFPTMLALALGRVTNFINGELWGTVTNNAICVNFRNTGGGDICRHPSTLYAAAKRFMIAGWLFFLTAKDSFKQGFIFWNFVFWEGLGRFIVDFYRADTLYGGLSLGQWFSLVMVIVAGYAFWRHYQKDWAQLLGKTFIKRKEIR